jgi:hypothetical protein
LGSNLILDEMIGKWTQPAHRFTAAESIVRLLESVTGKTMDEIAKENKYDQTDCFDDTINDYANFLKQSGISDGVDGVRFDPDGIFTRAQMVTMLGRMAKNLLGIDTAGFPKGSTLFSDVPDWADEFVGWAGAAGITDGVGGGRFDSNGPLQNQHTGVFSYRAFAYFNTDSPPKLPEAAPVFNFADATLYSCDGLKIAIPNEYLGKLIIDAKPVVNNDIPIVLFTVHEKQSVEDVIKDMDPDSDMGWLFSIVRYTPEQHNKTIGEDNSGMSFFAKDDSYYYCNTTASDVRLYREGGELTADVIAEWKVLNLMGVAVSNDIIARNELVPYDD